MEEKIINTETAINDLLVYVGGAMRRFAHAKFIEWEKNTHEHLDSIGVPRGNNLTTGQRFAILEERIEKTPKPPEGESRTPKAAAQASSVPTEKKTAPKTPQEKLERFLNTTRADEIRAMQTLAERRNTVEFISEQPAAVNDCAVFLREIAAQLAELNEHISEGVAWARDRWRIIS